MTLTCVPEWCEHEDGPETHDAICPEAPWPLTKAGFVDAAAISARNAVEAYRILLADDLLADMSEEQRLEMVESEAEEAAICYVGIGSCGRGWCKHG